MTCEVLGGNTSLTLRTAAALEIFQNWILIHDDIEDFSEMRRGEPVLHKKYGIPLAINAGDALHGKMWEVLIDNKNSLGSEKTLQLMNEFLTMINQTTEGQQIELSWVYDNNWDLSIDDYYLMVKKKTSWYTCITPCRLGAIIAGSEKKILDSFIPFGYNLGIAFQIKDDLLNLKGDEKKYGKESGGDILEGKRTLLLINLLSQADSGDKNRILAIMNKKRTDRNLKEMEEIMELMEKYDSFNYASSKAEEYAKEAKIQFLKIYEDIPKSSFKSLLDELINFIVQRDW